MMTILAAAFWHPFILKQLPAYYYKIVYVVLLPALFYQSFCYFCLGKHNKVITDHPRLTVSENRIKRRVVIWVTIIGLTPTYILGALAIWVYL